MNKLYIVKIGGNIIDHEGKLEAFLRDFATIKEHKILVHGGGKLATKLAAQLGIPQQIVEGRRITDAETLKVITMVYAGQINKNIIAQLQSAGCNAIGLSGADGNAILAHKRTGSATDYGFAGDIDAVNSDLLNNLLERGLSIVLAPVTHNGHGQLLNTNADTIAQEVATAMSSLYSVSLVFGFEKSGVLRDADNDDTVIRRIDRSSYHDLRSDGTIFEGMIPKLDNAFAALDKGVARVIIGNAEDLQRLIEGRSGTLIATDEAE